MLTPTSTAGLSLRADNTAVLLRKRDGTTVQALITQVILHPSRIDIELATSALAETPQLDPAADAPTSVTLTAEVTLTRTGRAMRLVHDNGVAAQPTASPSLVKLLIKARRWWKALREGELDISALATAEGVQPAYITRVVRLAFLSPAVVHAILKGGVRAEVNSTTITAVEAVSACWKAQARTMLPAAPIS